jgi:hypothetical protein
MWVHIPSAHLDPRAVVISIQDPSGECTGQDSARIDCLGGTTRPPRTGIGSSLPATGGLGRRQRPLIGYENPYQSPRWGGQQGREVVMLHQKPARAEHGVCRLEWYCPSRFQLLRFLLDSPIEGLPEIACLQGPGSTEQGPIPNFDRTRFWFMRRENRTKKRGLQLWRVSAGC